MRALALALLVTLGLSGAADAQSPRPVHGADAVFVAAQVVIVWSVLRGADENSTVVVITVAPRRAALPQGDGGVRKHRLRHEHRHLL